MTRKRAPRTRDQREKKGQDAAPPVLRENEPTRSALLPSVPPRASDSTRQAPLPSPVPAPVSVPRLNEQTIQTPPSTPVDIQQVVQRTASMELEQKPSVALSSMFTQRPGFGKVGKKIGIFANHFKVSTARTGDVYHYDVTIKRDNKVAEISKEATNRLMKQLLTDHRAAFGNVQVASDGRKNLYCVRELPFSEKSFVVSLDVAEFELVVHITDPAVIRIGQLDDLYSGRINYTPYEAIQALDIAMHHTAGSKFTLVGRSIFSNVGAGNLGQGAEVWHGYFQSLRPTQSRTTLNVDLAATAFVRSLPALDFLKEVLDSTSPLQSLDRRQHELASKSFSGVKVKTCHRQTSRTYRVLGLSRETANTAKFDQDGKKVTVASYFRDNYRALQYPNLPVLLVGSPQKPISLPLEVCKTIEGQKCPRKISDTQVAEMIKHTCIPPHIRRQKIMQKLQQADFARDPIVKEFGIQIEPEMIRLSGRQLPVPRLLYGKNQTIQPSVGSWNMKGMSFFQPKALTSWAVVNFSDPRRTGSELDVFLKGVQSQLSSLGLSPPRRLPTVVLAGRNEEASRVLRKAMAQAEKDFGKSPQFFLCVLAVSDATLYGEIKRASDTELGIPSQCMLSKHLRKCSPQYIANILLKVNVKLGGRNNVIQGNLPMVPTKSGRVSTIVFGADVTHPSPSETSKPSVASVVASMDAYVYSHAAAIMQQGHRVERIENLKVMVKDLLKRFYVANSGAKPDRILFYRDGVSEGQFQMVMNYEVTAIKEACAELEKGYSPSITFIIVQKRHHTRFFAVQKDDADKSGNVPAGTVVDTDVCHPREFDFYLMSHAGLQGTSRPTHYHVVFDENCFDADTLQQLTYQLCYIYCRCTRSVSIVPSVYYAHLVAYRARFFQDEGESGRAMERIHANLSHVMFYA